MLWYESIHVRLKVNLASFVSFDGIELKLNVPMKYGNMWKLWMIFMLNWWLGWVENEFYLHGLNNENFKTFKFLQKSKGHDSQ